VTLSGDFSPPRRHVALAEIGLTRWARDGSMSGKTAVLIVEDEVLIRMDIAYQLSDEGYEVFEAGNADQAIAILESEPSIRLLFTDIDMPGSMNGLKLAAAVRDRWPPVKIVVTSGHRIVKAIEIPHGGVFMSKPYQHEVISACFRELLLS
jgi:DNA-binding NtrC family response regulator